MAKFYPYNGNGSTYAMNLYGKTSIIDARNITAEGDVNIGEKLTVEGTLGVSGESTLDSASITNNATVGGTLGVTGLSTLEGNVTLGPISNGSSITTVNSKIVKSQAHFWASGKVVSLDNSDSTSAPYQAGVHLGVHGNSLNGTCDITGDGYTILDFNNFNAVGKNNPAARIITKYDDVNGTTMGFRVNFTNDSTSNVILLKEDSISLNENTDITGTLEVNGDVEIGGKLTVNASTQFGNDSSFGSISYPNSTDIYGKFTVNGNYDTAVGIVAGTSSGNVTTNATAKFHCYHKTLNDPDNFTGIKHFASIASGQSNEYSGFDDISRDQLNFTGQHRTHETQESGSLDEYVGCIVVSAGVCDDIRINEALPRVKLSTKTKDKRCFGVISNKEDPNGSQRTYSHGFFQSHYDKGEKESKIIINSLGEGAVWVCNENGPIENGDYITTSTQAGLGMKQDDDNLHNYSVAKITMDCDFNPKMIPKKTLSGEFDDIGRPIYDYDESELVPEYIVEINGGIKRAFVSCTYHCG